MNDILAKFGITPINEPEQIHENAWKIDDRYILKKLRNIESLERSLLLSELLLREELPVVEYIRIPSCVTVGNDSYCVMKLIRGSFFDPFTGDITANGHMLGQIIARLHVSLKKIEDKIQCYNSYYYEEMKKWDLNLVSEDVINACHDFRGLYDKLPRQLIHRDMHLWNLLFDDGKLAGYLDFDICQRNVRIFDICYMGLSELAGKYHNADKLTEWQKLFTNIIRGYDSITSLTDDELHAIPMICVIIELTFTGFYHGLGLADQVKFCVEFTEWLYKNKDKIPQKI